MYKDPGEFNKLSRENTIGRSQPPNPDVGLKRQRL